MSAISKREEYHAEQNMPSDVRLMFAGIDRRHSTGTIRFVRNYFLFHYVLSGKGHVDVNGKRHMLTKGGGFFFFPGQYHEYGADPSDPWGYAWTAFDGNDAARLLANIDITRDRSVFSARYSNVLADTMEAIIAAFREHKRGASLTAHAQFFAMLGNIASVRGIETPVSGTPARAEVSMMLEYISKHIASPLSVRALAEYVNIDPDYAFKLFKQETGKSIKRYIIDLRMDSAKNMLRVSDEDVGAIAGIVGYENYFTFTRLFKKMTGMTPSEFRAAKDRKPAHRK
ncbi:MAG: helix-turn-helix transcriptional regulator [Spirochaetes bacterium]|nr:helix-turn-helix transcriptional regulator [Spirochaetota bacterium]